jgi:hypothetical protein
MGLGGGIYLGSSSYLTVKSSIISHNLGSKGGGIIGERERERERER